MSQNATISDFKLLSQTYYHMRKHSYCLSPIYLGRAARCSNPTVSQGHMIWAAELRTTFSHDLRVTVGGHNAPLLFWNLKTFILSES